MSTIICFDFGLVRTGVAIGNTITNTATPECTLISKNNKPDWAGISSLIKTWQPSQLVVGLPTELDGSDSHLKPAITRFCNQLNGRYNLAVAQENEQYTSIEAAQRLKETRQQGRKRKVSKEDVDQISATIILENYFNTLKNNE
ncbi:MAG TPA: Holliday junction resolvase RuvX [Leucothrix mucor]|nr:Holliday junction resolvase RuvX [Leucothrix mucor]